MSYLEVAKSKVIDFALPVVSFDLPILMQHPFTRHGRLWYYLSVWALIALTHTIALVQLYDLPWSLALTDALVFNLAFYGTGFSYWYAVRYINIEGSPSLNTLLTHTVGIGLLVTIAVYGTRWFLGLLFVSRPFYLDVLQSSLSWRFFLGILYLLNIVLVYYLIKYYTLVEEKTSAELNLKSLIKEAELGMLKLQINPHFIFNSLNSVSALTLSRPDKAREMIIKLSAFLRYSLSEDSKAKHTLTEEIAHIQHYLDIEKVRFGDKLNIHFEIAEECGNITVPNLVLQPLLENAIKYGIYESLGMVDIQVCCQRQQEKLRVSIDNAYDPEGVPKKGKGLGLKNVRERLHLLYGGQAGLSVKKGEQRFEVVVEIPDTGK